MTKKINSLAFVFPGQGSQAVGMMADFYDNLTIVQQTYEEASDALGFDLWALTKEGPAEALNKTENTQPAMLVAGVAAYRALLTQLDISPAYCAGHSLGEYSALVASRQISLTEAVKLARLRALAMQKAVPEGVGAMAAILGLDNAKIAEICQFVSAQSDNKVWPANDNAPGQVVIAGHAKAVEVACEQLKSAGAKRALPLPVSVPSHCPLMNKAADELLAELNQITWQSAQFPVIHNVDVTNKTDDKALIEALCQQLCYPVKWVDTVQFFANNGIDTLLELGPGKVLTGLNKRIEKSINSVAVFDTASLNGAVELLK